MKFYQCIPTLCLVVSVLLTSEQDLTYRIVYVYQILCCSFEDITSKT